MKPQHNILSRTLLLVNYYPRSIGWILTRLVALTVLLSLLGLLIDPSYRATCTVTTLPSGFDLAYTEARVDVHSALGPAMVLSQTHTEFLLSRSLAEGVVDAMAAEGTPLNGNGNIFRKYVAGPVRGLVGHTMDLLNYGRVATRDPREAKIRKLRRHTTVNNVPGSFILEISVDWTDPLTAAKAANTITERYIEWARAMNREEMRVTREYINDSIAGVEGDLANWERKIESFKADNQIFLGETDAQLALETLTANLQDLGRVRSRLAELDTKYDMLDDYSSPASLAELRADIGSLAVRREALESQVSEQLGDLKRYPPRERELLSMLRRRATLESTLAVLYENLVKTKIAEAAEVSSVRVIDQAQPPELPAKPRLLFNAIAALLVGIVLSAGYIGITEAVHGFMRMRSDFERAGIPLAGVVPYDPAASRSDKAGAADRFGDTRPNWVERLAQWGERAIFAAMHRGLDVSGVDRPSDIGGVINTHIDHLLARLLSQTRDSRIVAFVSPFESAGKDLVLERVARRAAYAGLRVLAIDGNIHHPSLHQAFGVQLQNGFLDLVTSHTPVADTIAKTDGGVDVIPAGQGMLDRAEPCRVDAAKEQFDAMSEQYDLILLATPAAKARPLSECIWKLAGTIVCVFDAMSSTKQDVLDMQDTLSQRPRATFFVLNNVRSSTDYQYYTAS